MSAEKPRVGTILLVDDTPTNLGVLFESLSDSGFRLLVAEDGESAIAQVHYLKPDLVLLDVMMPGIDGFETCRRLKAEVATQDIPIIFMTALTDPVDKVKGLQIGAVDYITKPFQPDEVLARIHTHLALQNLQKQLQAQNLQLQAEILERQKVEQALRLLLHSVSHDLRNPVMGMTMVLQNLLKASDPDVAPPTMIPVSHSVLLRMAASSKRQLRLINSLLEAHTIETQGLQLHRQPLQLQPLIEQIVTEWQPLLQQCQATLHFQIAAALPLVNADADQLWRVFENLLANGLKHNPPQVSLVLTVQSTPTSVHCALQDDGVGMTTEQCQQIFELYQQGTTHRRREGLGLGLYLCRQIIIAHGGTMGVTSHPGSGTTFWFTLPLANPSEG
ncbi:histidine kinase [Neosynechococcus sphagnicola sy1]|uniref:histidine kinase n=1 Tax=Neosynechococcus sphagnicola sy1 TaxID=1497020 RepID=A0A098TM81_9CYAN|nr:hybrid sensor histidine kinase/response regulator [Neosynechococcus sphagnicola]KGF72972.1 histidine kinase [Neosynechococcus sphagnicola sy1]